MESMLLHQQTGLPKYHATRHKTHPASISMQPKSQAIKLQTQLPRVQTPSICTAAFDDHVLATAELNTFPSRSTPLDMSGQRQHSCTQRLKAASQWGCLGQTQSDIPASSSGHGQHANRHPCSKSISSALQCEGWRYPHRRGPQLPHRLSSHSLRKKSTLLHR